MNIKGVFPIFLLLLGIGSVAFSYYYNQGSLQNLFKKNKQVQQAEVNEKSVLSNQIVISETPLPTPTIQVEPEIIVSTPVPSFSATMNTETKFVGDGNWTLSANVSANKEIKSCDFEIGYPGVWATKSGDVAGTTCRVESDRLNFEYLKAWVKVTSKNGDVFEKGDHPYN
ncbi:hypothetical protein A2714_00200 [Candidatus Woesebacteria bacterium RIFCSPHIGHO2_01_FULL_38_9]|uniref:Uncharacterized protein n=2 Tax=Candidatus Woeseibacteriota TaxID=1752722 RepID=A0A1F7Y4P7_9BACT|nr:MAG: hypothetical protein A2714_00200 [Candidatus Woesebacteria bacterium RIFCSPHIGHO2_01_FULL_38_9]OGM58254.1 MAG: hypothetical protein A3A75_04415 [Candidatus Woesebacteria bacterium RIFCSPLOWO2_01_FULL_39_10]